MNAKIFSYKVKGIQLEAKNDLLKMIRGFDRKAILEPLKDILKAENFQVDESSLNYKLIDGQLNLQGLAIEIKAHKTLGFQFGK